MPIQLDPVKLDHFEGAPLKLALAQVRYRPILAVEQAAEVDRFAKELGDEWFLADRGQTQAGQLEFAPDGVRHAVMPPEMVWSFADKDNRFVLALSQTSVGLESRRYHSFDQFVGQLRDSLGALATVFAPTRRTRLGVRFINHINDERLKEPEGLARLMNDELIKPAAGVRDASLISSLAEIRLQRTDGIFVLRHGLVEPARYLLDFDYFDDSEMAYDSEGVLKSVGKFHEAIEASFCWSLKPEHLDELRDRQP